MKNILKSFYTFFIILFLTPHLYADQKNGLIFVFPEWKPYHYVNEKGQNKGIFPDILELIFDKKLGIKVISEIQPWKRAQYNVKTGKADVMITFATDNRLKYCIKSNKPFINIRNCIFTYKDHIKISDINKIRNPMDIKLLNLIPVTNLGNQWHKETIDSLGINTRYVPHEKNSFMVVAQKRADITIEALYAGYYLINELGLNNKVVATKGMLEPIEFHLLMSKKSIFKDKIKNFDKEFLNSKKEIKDILNKYTISF